MKSMTHQQFETLEKEDKIPSESNYSINEDNGVPHSRLKPKHFYKSNHGIESEIEEIIYRNRDLSESD